jgi:predicted MFS family arabinose efflux permease
VRLIRLAPDRAPMTLSLHASAIYLGIAAGSAFGGVAIDLFGVSAVGWVGGAFQLAGLMLLLQAAHKAKTASSLPATPAAA